MNTFYEHKDIHRFTSVLSSRVKTSIIDYVMAEQENRPIIRAVKVKIGYEIYSGHYLRVAEMRIKEEKTNKDKEAKQIKLYPEGIKSYKLQNKIVANRYENKLNKKLPNVPEITGNTDF